MPATSAETMSSSVSEPAPHAEARSFFTRPVLAGLVGNVMEWYDFMIYGYFAEVLGKLFFPAQDELASLLAVYGVFAISFVVRPFGAAVFGHIGDTFGRKRALELSVLLMAIPTFLLGLLPAYDVIGLAAPILLTILRLLQGLSVGGEYTSSFSFVIEHAPGDRRGLHGALTTCGAILGILLASAVAVITTRVAEAFDAQAWAWRLPFVLGIVVAALGLWVRRGLHETPAFENLKARGAVARNPLRDALSQEWPRILKVVFVYCLGSAIFYILFFFVQASLAKGGMAKHLALGATSISLCILVVALPSAALLSDKIGRRPVVVAGCLATVIGAIPLYELMMKGSFLTVLVVQGALTLISAAVMGPIPAMITEMFPARTRFSALSLGYNASLALFGGTAPMIATALIRHTANVVSPAYYLTLLGIVSGAVAFFSRETHRDDIS